jgi:protein-S-isoprenylcysteine O-methyltransferase Ste14
MQKNSENRLFRPIQPEAPKSFVAAVAFMIGLHLLEPGWQLWAPPWSWLGGIPALAGLGLNIWAVQSFGRHGADSGIGPNIWVVAIFKHIRPAEPQDQRRVLITDGPFAWTRHPMYLGMMLAIAGLAVLFGSATPFIVVVFFAAIMDKRHAGPEEAALEQEFGDEYRAYAARVRRWI